MLNTLPILEGPKTLVNYELIIDDFTGTLTNEFIGKMGIDGNVEIRLGTKNNIYDENHSNNESRND